jgi:hypothetical protein
MKEHQKKEQWLKLEILEIAAVKKSENNRM